MATNVTGVTSYFPSPQNNFATSLASNISAGATTVPLNSVAGYTNGQTAVFVIEPTATEQQTFTGVINTSTISVDSVVWTAGTNVAHSGGATVVDYATATHIAMMSRGMLVQHNQNGTHKDTLVALLAGAQTFTGVKTFSNGTVLSDGDVAANELSASAITLGYAAITSNFSTASATAVLVTGLTAAVTIPSGGRKVRITAYTRDAFSSASASMQLTIWDGTVGSGTQLSSALFNNGGSTGASASLTCTAIVSPSAGAKTYNVGFQVAAGTGQVEAGSTYPAYILVEVI